MKRFNEIEEHEKEERRALALNKAYSLVFRHVEEAREEFDYPFNDDYLREVSNALEFPHYESIYNAQAYAIAYGVEVGNN